MKCPLPTSLVHVEAAADEVDLPIEQARNRLGAFLDRCARLIELHVFNVDDGRLRQQPSTNAPKCGRFLRRLNVEWSKTAQSVLA